MNERIMQLAKEAGINSVVPVKGSLEYVSNGEVESLKKFAELIVRECAKVLTQHGAYFSGDGEPYHYAASLIEEHFGVE
jgi:hypothetical protein